MDKKKTAIVISVFDRPEYTAKCLKSLENNTDYAQYPLFILADGPPPDDEISQANVLTVRKQLKNLKHPNKIIIARNENVGVGINITEGKNTIFDTYDFDQLILCVDDCLFAPYAIRALLTFHEALGKKLPAGELYTTDLFSPAVMTKEEKLRHMSTIAEGGGHVFYVLTREIWELEREMLEEYLTLFIRPHVGNASRPYRQRKHDAVREWLEKKLGSKVHPRYATSQDAVVSIAMKINNINPYTSYVIHVVNIGVHGEHCTPAVYNRLRFGEQRLDDFPPELVIDALKNPKFLSEY